MTVEIAVVDAGPLIAFHQVERMELLRDLFDRVVIPLAVANEVAPSVGRVPSWIAVQSAAVKPRVIRKLGAGEREAIALTIQLSADFVVLDDLDARSAAIEFGLSVIGSLGLLVRAKRRELIGEVRPLMDAMISHGLFVSGKLYRDILETAGEADTRLVAR